MNVRVLCNQGGSISIIHPAPKSKRPNETDEQWLARVFAKATPEGTMFKDIEKAAIPPDRTFREAWELNGDTVSVNMDKARSIQMDRIRASRNKKLIELDVEYMVALEDDDKTKANEVAAIKKTLRDIPQNFDLTVASTPEELKGMMPDILRT